jgi:hypothetical protein
MPELFDGLIGRLDTALGAGVETAVVAKHTRRLQRLGWSRALKPTGSGIWARGGAVTP